MQFPAIIISHFSIQMFFSNINTFLRCLKITLIFSLASFTLISIVFFNEPFDEIPRIILGGLALSIVFAMIMTIWYRTSEYDISTATGAAFLNVIKKNLRNYNLEVVSETSEVLLIRSTISNIFSTNNFELVIHVKENEFHLEGYNFLIKRILKNIPGGVIIHSEKNNVIH